LPGTIGTVLIQRSIIFCSCSVTGRRWRLSNRRNGAVYGGGRAAIFPGRHARIRRPSTSAAHSIRSTI
jgi:hypothetical protein